MIDLWPHCGYNDAPSATAMTKTEGAVASELIWRQVVKGTAERIKAGDQTGSIEVAAIYRKITGHRLSWRSAEDYLDAANAWIYRERVDELIRQLETGDLRLPDGTPVSRASISENTGGF